jgi:hypothetical protein
MSERPRVMPSAIDEEEQTGDDFWQWVALIVLLACWLAEAALG